jgi:hypothetical protein
MSPEHEMIIESFRQAVQAGMSPQKIANYVFQAIRDEQFYILTHSDWNSDIQK